MNASFIKNEHVDKPIIGKRSWIISQRQVEPLALPEVTLLPGDKLYLHASLKYPVYAVHRKAIELGKKRIQANDLIFLKRNGRIKTREH